MSHDHPCVAEIAGIRDALAGLAAPWQCGETRLSRLTRESRKARLGVPAPSADELAARADLPRRMAEFALAAAGEPAGDHPSASALPSAFDLRDVDGRDYVTPVKDQGERGSCSAFATIAAVETTAAYARRAPALRLDLSEAHLYFGHAVAREAITPDGTWPDEMFTDCATIGVTFEDCYPYTADNARALNPGWRDRLATARGVVDLSRDPVAIKRHIHDHGAVAACLVIYDDLFHYTGGVYRHTTEETSGGHCVALVGWDDDGGCWIAKNSWGPDWGEGGFLRIAYGEAYIEDYPDPRPTTLGCTDVSLHTGEDTMTDTTPTENAAGADEPEEQGRRDTAPLTPAGWEPYAPPPAAPTGWEPYSPPPVAPTGWEPYSPPPRPAPSGNGTATGGWVPGRAVTHLWSSSDSPGVWINVHGIGWKRLAPASDSGDSHLTLLALLARNYRLAVSYHEDSRGQIDQLVV